MFVCQLGSSRKSIEPQNEALNVLVKANYRIDKLNVGKCNEELLDNTGQLTHAQMSHNISMLSIITKLLKIIFILFNSIPMCVS